MEIIPFFKYLAGKCRFLQSSDKWIGLTIWLEQRNSGSNLKPNKKIPAKQNA